jgi:hypothetical protein
MAALALICATFGSSYLAAQSMTSQATQGLYTTDADKYLDVNDWQDVVVNKAFAFLKGSAARGIGAGTAFNLGPAFIGIGYAGKFWSAQSYSLEYDYGPISGSKDAFFNNYYSDLAWINRISVLIGTRLLGGILIDVDVAGLGNDNADYDDGSNPAVEDSNDLGAIQGSLSWGKNFKVSSITIKPKLGFAYNFNNQKREYRVTEPAASPTTRTLEGTDLLFNEFYGINNADLFSGGKVGLTGFWTANAGLSLNKTGSLGDGSLWLNYELQSFAYDRQTKRSNGTYKDYSPAHQRHGINLGVGAWYDLDEKVSFAWSAEVDGEFEKAEINSGKTEAAGAAEEFEYTAFSIAPSVSAGFAYKLIPEKFNINTALRFIPLSYTNTEISKTATATKDTTTDTLNDIGGMGTITSMGFTWFIVGGLSLDAAMEAAYYSRLDIGSVSILASYKF